MAVSGSHLRDIKPELSAASPSQTFYVTIFKTIHTIPFSWRHQTDRFYPLFIAALSRVRLLLYFVGRKVWRLAKTWAPTFSIIGNFVAILSAHLSHSFILCFPISSSVILLDVYVDGLSDYLNSSSPSKAGHISFEEWQAHSRRDQSNAKLKFKRKLKSM